MRHRVPFWRFILVFVGLIAAYMAFALVSNLLPDEPIRRHAAKTLERQDLVMDFGFAVVCQPEYYMDNFTDALILNQACCGGSDRLLTSMLLVPRRYDGVSECSSLKRVVEQSPPAEELHYGRYWHGSTFLMRLLLLFDSYVVVRQVLYLLSSLLLLWLAVAMARRVGLWAAMLYALSLLLTNLFVMQLSIQFVTVLLIALGGSLWVLYRVNGREGLCMLLFVVGSLTAFFDLLTCPVLTWGLPLCTYLLCNAREQAGQPLGRGVVGWLSGSVLWAVGYGATWVGKWVIATVLTGENVMADGLSQFAVRAAEGGEVTRWGALLRNMGLVQWRMVSVVLLLLVVLAVCRFDRRNVKSALLCLLTALPPCLWYMAASNHSYLHYWFTYRSVAVVLAALFFAVGLLVDWRRLKGGVSNATE